jgi:hypothetical protein
MDHPVALPAQIGDCGFGNLLEFAVQSAAVAVAVPRTDICVLADASTLPEWAG